MSNIDALGYLASSLVLATFCMRSMYALRFVAISSNLAFMAYGFLGDLMPILLLHAALLPVNIVRLQELGATRRTGFPQRKLFPGP
jgi:hypothetical protein